LYRKVNGSLKGLEDRIGKSGATLIASNVTPARTSVPSQTTEADRGEGLRNSEEGKNQPQQMIATEAQAPALPENPSPEKKTEAPKKELAVPFIRESRKFKVVLPEFSTELPAVTMSDAESVASNSEPPPPPAFSFASATKIIEVLPGLPAPVLKHELNLQSEQYLTGLPELPVPDADLIETENPVPPSVRARTLSATRPRLISNQETQTPVRPRRVMTEAVISPSSEQTSMRKRRVKTSATNQDK